MRRITNQLIRCVVMCGLISALAVGTALSEEEAGEVEERESEPRHALGVFVGATTSEHETGPSLGVEYEYVIMERLGVGGIFEFTFEQGERELALLVPAYIRFHPIILVAALGAEISPEHDSAEEESGERETSLLGRLGVEYMFEVGEYEIGPSVNWDIAEGADKLVWGVAFARLF